MMRKKWTPTKLKMFELEVKQLFEEGQINCPIHLSGGNEKQLIALFENIKPKDWVFSTHRNHYHYLLKGGVPTRLMDEIKGKETGICHGKGRSMHIFDKELNFYTSAIVGGNCAIAVGVALSLKKRYKGKGRRPMVWCFNGDGAEDTGRFAESVRFALARELPITFIIEDNNYAVEASKEERWHNYHPVQAKNIMRITYERMYPHVGIGFNVSM